MTSIDPSSFLVTTLAGAASRTVALALRMIISVPNTVFGANTGTTFFPDAIAREIAVKLSSARVGMPAENVIRTFVGAKPPQMVAEKLVAAQTWMSAFKKGCL